jgi:hypothetical protein
MFVSAVLFLHIGLLAWSAARHSPTIDEVGHLPAGISHWEQGRFELYRVNPPLVRMVAAIPVLLSAHRTDWHTYTDDLGARPEFSIGYDFILANGDRSFALFTLARWACIPFSLLGALVCHRWARELYGGIAGEVALVLWCTSPNILAHASMITPDVGAAAFSVAACYAFWHWLRSPTLAAGLFAGVTLGWAQLTKTTCVELLALWPMLWLGWTLSDATRPSRRDWLARSGMLAAILACALGVLNAGYGFSGSFRSLGDYRFLSKTLAGPLPDSRGLGNRFVGTSLARVPVPLPRDYLQGIDVQWSDFESGARISYLRGEFRQGGWWHYYVYALLVKVPLGTWALLLLGIVSSLRYRGVSAGWRDEMLLWAPALSILALVSSQRGFNHHLRYVLTVLPFMFIWAGRVGSSAAIGHRWLAFGAASALLWSVASSLSIYPHSLSYFNELAGGPTRGHEHLLDSNIDWGQDLCDLKRWVDEHPESRPMRVAYFGMFDPRVLDPGFTRPPEVPTPGWFAVSVNTLHGYRLGGLQREPDETFGYFRQFEPIARAGYSILIYHITPKEADAARTRLSLPARIPPQ